MTEAAPPVTRLKQLAPVLAFTVVYLLAAVVGAGPAGTPIQNNLEELWSLFDYAMGSSPILMGVFSTV